MNDPKLHLLYILETIAKIHRLMAKGKPQIEASDDATAALLFYLHTMAESTQRLPDSLTQTYPAIPWATIGSFRNRIVHGYIQINMAVIWAVVDNDLESLRAAVEVMLETLDKSTDAE